MSGTILSWSLATPVFGVEGQDNIHLNIIDTAPNTITTTISLPEGDILSEDEYPSGVVCFPIAIDLNSGFDHEAMDVATLTNSDRSGTVTLSVTPDPSAQWQLMYCTAYFSNYSGYLNKGYYADNTFTSSYEAQATPLAGGTNYSGKELTLIPEISGDITQDGELTLADVIRGLQVITSMNPELVGVKNDVDGDEKIGLGDILHALNEIAAQSGN